MNIQGNGDNSTSKADFMLAAVFYAAGIGNSGGNNGGQGNGIDSLGSSEYSPAAGQNNFIPQSADSSDPSALGADNGSTGNSSSEQEMAELSQLLNALEKIVEQGASGGQGSSGAPQCDDGSDDNGDDCGDDSGDSGTSPYGNDQGNSPYGGNQGNSPFGNSGYGGNQGNSPFGNSGYGGNQGNSPFGNSGNGGNQGNSPFGNSGNGGNPGNSPFGNSGYGGNQGNSPFGNSGYGGSEGASNQKSHGAGCSCGCHDKQKGHISGSLDFQLNADGGSQKGTDAPNGFDFKSWGDPHVTTNLNGKTTEQQVNGDTPNLNTVQNTKGGATTLGTKEMPGPNGTQYNKEADLRQKGPNGFDLKTTTDGNGSMQTAVKDGNGTHQLQDGQTLQEGNGTQISMQGGNVHVSQQTTSGGNVQTTIGMNEKGLDVDQKGTGDAKVSGKAEQLNETTPEAQDTSGSQQKGIFANGGSGVNDAQQGGFLQSLFGGLL